MDERDYIAMNKELQEENKEHEFGIGNYFKKYKTPILIGFALGTTLSIVLNLIENIVIKIALIIYGS